VSPQKLYKVGGLIQSLAYKLQTTIHGSGPQDFSVEGQ